MGIRDWINGLRQRQVPSENLETDQRVARWQKALSDFGYPYDVVSGSTVEDAFSLAKSAGDRDGFVPVVLVPGYWNSRRRTPDVHYQPRSRATPTQQIRKEIVGLRLWR